MAGDAHEFPRTLEEIFGDFKGRRKALISALTTDVEEFFIQCNPARRALCLYGFPNGLWQVSLPVEMVPSNLPEPTLGINIARDEMQEKNWLALVAARSDAWLLSVAFYFGARLYFGKPDREHLFNMIHGLPTISEVVTKKKVEDKSSGTNHSDSKSLSNSKLDKDEDEDDKYENEDKDGDEDEELAEEEEILDLLLHMQKMVL